MKIWIKTDEFSEGKFLVIRRDGTMPSWPHFVLGARDLASPAALRAYADEMEANSPDTEYVASVRELAGDFEAYRSEHGNGDPEAPPHRTDLPMAIAMMRGELTLDTISRALEKIEVLSSRGESNRAQCLARLLLDGRTPAHLDTTEY